MKKRQHPLVPLVAWLGCGLVASLMALVWVIGQLPEDRHLARVHLDGMKEGYSLCLAYNEATQEERKPAAAAVKPFLLRGL